MWRAGEQQEVSGRKSEEGGVMGGEKGLGRGRADRTAEGEEKQREGPARDRNSASSGTGDPAKTRESETVGPDGDERAADGAEARHRAEGAGSENAGARHAQVAKLTDRDRDILGILSVTRYLTAQQVHRLAFDGRNISAAYRRLLKLSRSDGQAPFVRQRFFRTYDGNRVAVWAPTPHGVMAASLRAPGLPELPKHDVGAYFLEHLVQLNELFVALWQTENGRCPRVAHPSYRWVPSDCVRLSWDEYEMRDGRRQLRVIQPDAVLELPVQRRRYFLECEMGGNTISPGARKPHTATLSKVERYQTYLCGPAELSTGRTYYDVQYRDGFRPEVLFLVRSDARVESINAALVEWRKRVHERRYAVMRALTFEAASGEFRGMVGLPLRPNMLPRRAGPATFTLTREEVLILCRYFVDSWASIKSARATVRQLKPPAPPLPQYPQSHESLRALLERLMPGALR